MSISRFRGRVVLATTVASLVAAAVLPASPSVAVTSGIEELKVDLGSSTGAFRGGANGSLYGLGDDGMPSQSVIDGAHVTNVSQKPPGGAQHPNGDALDVEKAFFAGAGQDLYVYIQDEYPDFAYDGGKRPGNDADGNWSYLAVIKNAVEQVATTSQHPKQYIFIPFNEPDGGNWYPDWSTQKDQFLADWTAAYNTIQAVYAEHGLGHAKVGGPGDSVWHEDRSRDLLTYGKANDVLPDVFIWHELFSNPVATFSGHIDQYRAILSDLSLKPIPVDITEYGTKQDMSKPGKIVQYLSTFERQKVDAQTAYWNYAGSLDDNMSRVNGANGVWWLYKWYGDLAGSHTVAVTPPQIDTGGTLQAVAAVDTTDKKATVLLGGGSKNVHVALSGIDRSVFGNRVTVTVRADRFNGDEGDTLQPPVISSSVKVVSGGSVAVDIPNDNEQTAYQVEITPGLKAQPVDTSLVNSTEAESATLVDAQSYTHDPDAEFAFPASRNADVGSFNKADSSATWSVTAPHDGTYRLSVLSSTNGTPGEHALFVDGKFSSVIHYGANLAYTYEGTAEADISLPKGQHTLSLRASKDGSTVLPGADLTLDRFNLTDVTGGEKADYPALDARLSGSARLVHTGVTEPVALLAKSGSATFFTAGDDTGYYDLAVRYATVAASPVNISVNGRQIAAVKPSSLGAWTSTVRVWLPEGVNEVQVTSPTGAAIRGISTTRSSAAKAAETPANIYRPALNELRLSGNAAIGTASASSNGQANADGTVSKIGYIGNGAGNTATIVRPAGFGAGAYVLTLGYANADKQSNLNYNPQLISRFLNISEAGGATVRGTYRNDYSYDNFWNASTALSLTTASGAITLGNASAYGPDVNTVTLAKQVVGSVSTVRG